MNDQTMAELKTFTNPVNPEKPEGEKQDEKTGMQDSAALAGEFKVTIRKLEMPVRPRGVLAE